MKTDRNLLQRLHDKGIINKKYILWWQLGFEGRKIHSAEEFRKGLQYVSYEQEVYEAGSFPHYEEREALVWAKDDVPINIETIELFEEKIPCFITIKPMSHDGGEGWRLLEPPVFMGPGVFHRPHIRGVVIEQTPEFLFWYAFLPQEKKGIYDTLGFFPKNPEIPPIILSPIEPGKFYENIIKRSLKKTIEKHPSFFALKNEGYEFVPYYEFHPDRNSLTIYPARAIEGRLDIPVVLKGSKSGYPEILGAGKTHSSLKGELEGVSYWRLDNSLLKVIKQSLIDRLGKL